MRAYTKYCLNEKATKQKRTYEINRKSLILVGDPYGTRTRVAGVRGNVHTLPYLDYRPQ